MDQYRDKFQGLLRELLQFDCADLNFGIYRIMNCKRDVIEKFISTDLPKAIADELDRGVLGAQSQAAVELAETAQQIAETLGKNALDADGNLAEAYHGTPGGNKYLDLRDKAAGGRGRKALEATIFNHLYAFFSRYYQDGDFISKRRYSKRQKYAIPYNGEEVYLHWANHDQYYVKTAEHFHDYTFTSRGVTVHFKLTAANVEQNNVKGDKRFFLPRVKEAEWNEKAGELVVPFEFLQTHPTLAIDTKHCSLSFADGLLASYSDLEDTTDGVLVHSENYQAMALLSERYRATVHCMYWDPPYNTGQSHVLSVIRGVGTVKTMSGQLAHMGFEFSYPKPIKLMAYVCRWTNHVDALIVDCFAGSGTTGHAAIALNREDGGRRKFILVEMGDYFDSVILPRSKKVTFSPEWSDENPHRSATSQEAQRGPRIIEYLRLESYEDTLNNIGFDDAAGQGALQFDDYLLGLHVSTRKAYDDGGRRYLVYHGRIDHRRIAVIWRETEGWQKKDLERDKKFVARQKLADGADEVFVNGDSFISNAKALEPVFKARMFSTVEA